MSFSALMSLPETSKLHYMLQLVFKDAKSGLNRTTMQNNAFDMSTDATAASSYSICLASRNVPRVMSPTKDDPSDRLYNNDNAIAESHQLDIRPSQHQLEAGHSSAL